MGVTVLLIFVAVLIIGSVVVFVTTNSNHEKEIHINNEKLDKMFEFLRSDVVALQKKLKNIEEQINTIQQVQQALSKRIEKLENETSQLRTGSNSRFY